MPVNGNIAVQRSVLPADVAGVDATARKMAEMAHSVYGSKSAKIRAMAIDILTRAGVPGKDYYGEIVALHNWVRDNIRYTRDPVGQETLSYPEETAFNSGAGDCDDMTILEMALLGAVGIESYPVVVGMFPNHYSHVYLHAKVPAGKGRNAGKIIPLDPIMKDWPAGREAAGVKAKKTYTQLSNPLTMNGLPMGQELGDLADLGTYAIAPSYLDSENSGADQIMRHDSKASHIHNDKTVANATRVNMPFEGLDGLFGGVGAGEAFTATSAGDGGTIVESGGQLVPKGFIRDEPGIHESMAMTPATAKQLGPRGPIFAYKAKQNKDYLRSPQDPRVPSIARQLANDKLVGGAYMHQEVGQKRYTLPTVAQQSRMGKGLVANPVQRIPKSPIVVLNSISLDRLGAPIKPLPSLGEELAGAEQMLAGISNRGAQVAQALQNNMPLAQKEALQKELASCKAKRIELERDILALRQNMRSQVTVAPKNPARSQAVINGQAQVAVRESKDNTGITMYLREGGWVYADGAKVPNDRIGKRKGAADYFATTLPTESYGVVPVRDNQGYVARWVVTRVKGGVSLAEARRLVTFGPHPNVPQRVPPKQTKGIRATVISSDPAQTLAQAKAVSRIQGGVISALSVNDPQRIGAVRPVQAINGLGDMSDYDEHRSSMSRPPGCGGLGDSFLDTLKKPIVWGPIAAFVGVVVLRMYLKRRSA